eukprot:gene8802-11884_t
MRVLRAKQIRRHLRFYRVVFDIVPPYNVILDGSFIFAAIKYKVDLINRIERLLQGEKVNLFILKSVINELKASGDKSKSSLEFAIRYCEVIDDGDVEGVNSLEKLQNILKPKPTSTLGNNNRKKKYFVASQDKETRYTISNNIAGIPLIYLNKVIFVLEPPSALSQNLNSQMQTAKISLNESESNLVELIKKRKREDSNEGNIISSSNGSNTVINNNKIEPVSIHKIRIKKKANAPNPLANLSASKDSSSSKKKKMNKFIR